MSTSIPEEQGTLPAAASAQPQEPAPKKNTKARVGAQKPHVTPSKAKSARKTTPAKQAPKGGKQAVKKEVKPASKKASRPAKATEAREGSKKSLVLELLRRPKGATLAELATATGWQNHSIRGFLSGALGKKMGLQIDSTKREDGQRTYQLAR